MDSSDWIKTGGKSGGGVAEAGDVVGKRSTPPKPLVVEKEFYKLKLIKDF